MYMCVNVSIQVAVVAEVETPWLVERSFPSPQLVPAAADRVGDKRFESGPGTRSLLSDRSWLPRRGEVRVTIGAAITPAGPGWDPALELRDAARKTIATTLAETTHDD